MKSVIEELNETKKILIENKEFSMKDLAKKNKAKINQLIKKAAKINDDGLDGDINDPLYAIQTLLGVDSGDEAGMYFSDWDNESWDEMSTKEKEKALQKYVEHEIKMDNFAGSKDSMKDLAKKNKAKINQLIKKAAKMNDGLDGDINDPLYDIQKLLGVDSGDEAGMYFSDWDNESWDEMSTKEKEKALQKYVEYEIKMDDF